MKEETLHKILEAERELGFLFPPSVRTFLLNMTSWENNFGEEEWYVDVINEVLNNKNSNAIISDSLDFREEWNLKGVVFAHNGMGDYLLLLPRKYFARIGNELDEFIYVLWHETAQIRIFASSIEDARQSQSSYTLGEEFVYSLSENGYLEEGYELKRIYEPELYSEYLLKKKESEENKSDEWATDDEAEKWQELHDKLSYADNLIDEERTDKIDEILSVLYDCINNEHLAARAFLKLGRLYMRGFGIPADRAKGIDYITKSAMLDNYNAMSDLSFFYYQGMGVKRNLNKAIEWMGKANEQSGGMLTERLSHLLKEKNKLS